MQTMQEIISAKRISQSEFLGNRIHPNISIRNHSSVPIDVVANVFGFINIDDFQEFTELATAVICKSIHENIDLSFPYDVDSLLSWML